MSKEKQESITEWIRDLKAGDHKAAAMLWDHYFDRLVGVARRKLGKAPRRANDEEDVALSVLNSLCVGAAAGQFSQLSNRNDLWKLLLAITRQKSVDQIRRNVRKKRGGGNVRGESVFGNPDPEQDSPGNFDDLPHVAPSPENIVDINDEINRLLNLLQSDTLRNMAIWRLKGHSNAMIAQRLGRSERTVERKLSEIRDQWAKELDR